MNTSLQTIIDELRCPTHGKPLTSPVSGGAVGVPWPDGSLRCPEGCTFSVRDGIPRFVAGHYAAAFGLQWRRYQRTQLDSYTGRPYSRTRLEKCLGMPLEALAGKTVLEVGSGAGRFTECMLPHAGALVSVDLSDAVDANLRNMKGKGDYLLLQADVARTPLPKRFFDVVVCVGVLQHTPSPEASIRALAEHLKPGGLLGIDHYRRAPGLRAYKQYLSLGYPLRMLLRNVEPEAGLKATIAITKVCDPIRRRTNKYFWLDQVASMFLPTACYYEQLKDLDPKIVYEWNELDTHDGLTDWYKHRRTVGEIDAFLKQIGLVDVECFEGDNGVVARAHAR